MPNYVSVILNLTDGEGNPVASGSATFTPSVTLTDVPDGVIITQAPIQIPFNYGGSPSVKLLATDNASPAPSGWAWEAVFSVNGGIAPYNFFVPAGPATFTATNASPAVFTWTPTAAFTAAALTTLPNGTGVQLSGGSLPAGFSAATTYYVVNSSGSTFQLSATSGGSALASTSTGSGNVTVTQYNLSSLSPVATVGASSPFMSLLTRTSVQTSNYTAGANQIVPVDTTSGAVTVTLPNAPNPGTLVGVKMVTQAGTNTVTVARSGSDVFNKTGGGTTGTLTLLSQGMLLEYNSGIWTVLSDDLPLSQLDARYAAESLSFGPPSSNGTVNGQVSVDTSGTPWAWNSAASTWNTGPSAQNEHLLSGNAKPEVNAVTARTLSGVAGWLAWLSANNVSGIITETQIPAAGDSFSGYTATATDTLRWSEVAEEYYRVLDDYSIPVIHFGTNPATAGAVLNPGQIYLTGSPGSAVTVNLPPSGQTVMNDPVIPILRHTRSSLKGIMLGGVVGVTPPAGFSNAAPYNASNWTCSPSTYAVAYAAGTRLVRISTRWETIQQTLGGALDTAELARLDAAITAAGQAGLKVVLDLHNYCSYITASSTLHVGDGTLTVANLTDVWTKISSHYKTNPNIYGYEIMNEPTGLPATSRATTTTNSGTFLPGQQITVASTAAFPQGRPFGITVNGNSGIYGAAEVTNPTTLTITASAIGGGSTWSNGAALDSPQLAWESMSQQVVTAIRGNSDNTPLIVAGYYWEKAAYYAANHPVAWITDTANAVTYAAHNYWSSSAAGDSSYQSWATELAQTVFTSGGGYSPLPAEHPFMGTPGGRLPMQSGEATMDGFCPGNTGNLPSPYVHFTCAVAGRTEPVNFIQVWTGGTPSSIAPTGAQLCIAQIGPDKSALIVAATANDTTLFAAANTGYKRQISAGMNGPVTVSAASVAGSTVTLTVSSALGFAPGQSIFVTGITGFTTNNPNGSFVVTAVNYGSNTISFVPASTPAGSYTSGGAVGIPWRKQAGAYYAVGLYINQASGTLPTFLGTQFVANGSGGFPLRVFRDFESSFAGCPGFIVNSHWVAANNAFYAEVTPS